MFSLFARDGHDVHVILAEPGPLVDLLEAEGIIVHIFRSLAIVDRQQIGQMSGRLAFCFRFPYSVLWVMALILKINADIIHTNTAVMPSPALAAFLTRRRHIWHIREYFSEFRSLWALYQQYICVLSHSVITISTAVKEQFAPKFRGKCIVAYNSLASDAMTVDEAKAQAFRESIGSPELLVGVVGRIKWVRKGQEILVKAAALLAEKHPTVRYGIVGSVSPGNEDHLVRLRELVSNSHLKDKVFFVGDVNQPRDIFAAFDITVVPSVLPEPFGRVVMESLAAGTPVIGSRCGGIPEQIVDGVTGLLFTPGDEANLAEALDQLLSDSSLRVQMGLQGVEDVKQRFEENVVYEHFSRIFWNAYNLT